VRITFISGAGVLSFDHFRLNVEKRLTFVVGPNGAGKSNLTRLVSICHRAVECGDGAAGDVERMLASFVAARYIHAQSPAIEARVGIRLTEPVERALVVEFVRAIVAGALGGPQAANIAEIEAWADAHITEDNLLSLMVGQIVARHPGTQDGWWQCWYEFTAIGDDNLEQMYRWYMLGPQRGSIVRSDEPNISQGGVSLSNRIAGSSPPPGGPVPVPSSFRLSDLLPPLGTPTRYSWWDSDQGASDVQRRFAQMIGLPLTGTASSRTIGLATVFRVIMRLALRQTSDMRLLPSGGVSWSSSDLTLTSGAEVRLPELLLHMKNGYPAQRAGYQRLRHLFTKFTQGRACEVRLMPAPRLTRPNGETSVPSEVPAVFVTVNPSTDPAVLAPEVPIEFAGAGAWEALVLASVLAEEGSSVVLLDEPAVALHPSLQRGLAAHLEAEAAQFLVITHSAELLPLGQAADVQMVRLDRDDQGATRAWSVDETCRVKMSRKLAAKGNERLPFAARAILGEGQDDQEAIHTLCERMGIDVRQRNIFVVDCGGRDNLPDYIWFCAQLGMPYLAVMDADASKPDAFAMAQVVRDTFKLHGGGQLVEFPENLEATFGVVKQRPSLVPAAIQSLPFVAGAPDSGQVRSEIAELAQAIQRLVS
jgi:predicted ATPase